jgi:uncharacterized repeat protein (TIGR03803 family)
MVCAGLAAPACAQVKENVILNFDFYNGAYPTAPLLADTTGPSGGVRGLFGTAGNEWGAAGVFKLTPPKAGKTGWKDTTLWTINKPFIYTGYGNLFAATKRITGTTALYGATEYGGNVNASCGGAGYGLDGCGAIYSVTGQTMDVLWAFTGGSDGGLPYDGVIGDKTGALYASTNYGGGPSGCGTIIQLTPPPQGQTAWTENTIYTFANTTDGCDPFGLIMDDSGAIYGVTLGTTTYGTVFKLTPPAQGATAWTEQTLWTLQGNDGATPVGLTPAKEGALYVVSLSGGKANDGSVLELTPPRKGQTAWTEKMIWNFTGGADGAGPYGPVIIDKTGTLYLTASLGGSCAYSGGCGTAVKLTPPPAGQTAWTETTLWSFSGNADGGEPMATLTADKSGTLYGTASFGGSQSFGVVFSLTGAGFLP